MLELKHLKEIDFFVKRKLILEEAKKLGIEDVLLSRPMVSAGENELQFIIKTNSKFDFTNHNKFLEKLIELFEEKAPVSAFEEVNVKAAMGQGVGMTYIYKNFLQSAIPIKALNPNIPLDNQWRVQENRAVAQDTNTNGVPIITQKLASIRINPVDNILQEKINSVGIAFPQSA